MPRTANIYRQTNETDISISLNIDGTGQAEIETGLGFFDHMLHHIAVHGLFDLRIKAAGDLHVDEHHTVEDVALVLGQAFAEALHSPTVLLMAKQRQPCEVLPHVSNGG